MFIAEVMVTVSQSKNVAFNNNVILNRYSDDVDNYSSCSEDGNDNENTDGFSSETVVDFEVGTKDIIICDERKGNIITEDIEEKKGEGILVEEADEVINEQKKTQRIQKSSDRIARDIRKHEILPACSCKRKCIEKVIEIERVVIHEGFWQKSYDDRACFIHCVP